MPIDLTSEDFFETAHRLNMLNAELRTSNRLRAERARGAYEGIGTAADWIHADDRSVGEALCRLVQALGDDLRTPELSLAACLAEKDHFRGPPPHADQIESGDVGEDGPTDEQLLDTERAADARAELRGLEK